MKRRQWVTAAVAGLAGLAGAGWGWWRLQPGAERTGVPDPSVRAIWEREWLDPHGQPVRLPVVGRGPVLLNFWATWCPPCVEELPLLNGFSQQQRGKGWQVVGMAVDQPSSVRAFLGRAPLDFPVVMAGLEGTELSRLLGNTTGGLPFSVLIDPAGRIAQRQLGRLHAEDLSRWAQAF
ncbi:MAG TPA: TlpA disulfide reductase family protein [Macromonas sp.]|nr:TlpA disulfide reductase family protein [Macromonas sp.]